MFESQTKMKLKGKKKVSHNLKKRLKENKESWKHKKCLKRVIKRGMIFKGNPNP